MTSLAPFSLLADALALYESRRAEESLALRRIVQVRVERLFFFVCRQLTSDLFL